MKTCESNIESLHILLFGFGFDSII